MPWPPEYQRASIDFEKFMVTARDRANLATTNMAWNMVVELPPHDRTRSIRN